MGQRRARVRHHQQTSWKDYLDPDGEMEIDLYRDDGIVHVIITGAQQAEDTLWVSSYFGACRYDGRNWRGVLQHGLRHCPATSSTT